MSNDYSSPTHVCDVVMKGGITSGVVYPKAVCEIAKKYRLKNIGGTSAGAIAAAAAAAAELGRHGEQGFAALEALPKVLSSPVAGSRHARLFHLFQPQAPTKGPYRVLTAALEGSGWSKWLRPTLAALRNHGLTTSAGVLASVALFVTIAQPSWDPLHVLAAGTAALLMLGFTLGLVAVVFVRAVAKGMSANYLGLCTGMSGKDATGEMALTDWLTGYFNELAGKDRFDRPLIFADLWGTEDPFADRKVNLEMMTTCLTLGRPFRLPFVEEADERGGMRSDVPFYFSPEEFRDLFPEPVVSWMEKHAPADSRADEHNTRQGSVQDGLPKRLLRLPAAAQLPIVVAVRMSLSFPVLLSAIPLYALDVLAKPKPRLGRCWFSDGGICVNLPVHFFDSPLPRWPTFAINLVERDPARHVEEVYMPKRNSDGMHDAWSEVGAQSPLPNVLSFFSAILGTMHNWSDNVQLKLPGFRDRIAVVGLNPDEGGMNLDMPPERIQRLTDRGGRAGSLLRDRFLGLVGECDMNWTNHRRIRLRAALASIEELLGRLASASNHPSNGDVGYLPWLQAEVDGDVVPYEWRDARQRQLAVKTLEQLIELERSMDAARKDGASHLGFGAPRPRPELRIRPRI